MNPTPFLRVFYRISARRLEDAERHAHTKAQIDWPRRKFRTFEIKKRIGCRGRGNPTLFCVTLQSESAA